MDELLALARWANEGGYVPPVGESVDRHAHAARSAYDSGTARTGSGGSRDRRVPTIGRSDRALDNNQRTTTAERATAACRDGGEDEL